MNKLLLTLLAGTIPLTALANIEVTKDGVTYTLYKPNGTTPHAEVSANTLTTSTNVVIEESITYDNELYPVTAIAEDAFFGCDNLNSITIPNSVTSIGDYSLGGTGLTSVMLGNAVKTIGSYAFYGSDNLTAITIPASVTSIGDMAFYYSDGLQSVTIDNAATAIGESAFQSCNNLTTVDLGNAVTEIGNNAFQSCCSLTTINIPASLTKINDEAFYYCSSLTSIEFPDTMIEIGNKAFYGCSGITSLSLPASVKTIGAYTFYNCTGLTALSLPTELSAIGQYAFSGCTGLKSVTLPESVGTFGNGVFAKCSGLSSISIPKSLSTIGNYMFDSCSGLTDVTIPYGVTAIGNFAFNLCSSLSSVTIPASVTSIGNYTFFNCPGLKTVNYNTIDPITASKWVFDTSTYDNGTLTVAIGGKTKAINLEPWKNFKNIAEKNMSEDTPQLWFGARNMEMRGKVGETVQQTMTIDGENLHGNIHLTAYDNHDGRSTAALTIHPTELSGPGEFTVSYNSANYDSNWIWVKATSDGAPDVYIDIQAENYKDPTISVDGDVDFWAYANKPVTHNFKVSGRDIKGWVVANLWGDNVEHYEIENSWGLKENTTIYFDNSRSKWDQVYVWLFDRDNPDYKYQGIDYPGILLKDRGDGTCVFTFNPDNIDQNMGVVFNDGLQENGQERQKSDEGHVIDNALYFTGGNSAWWHIPGRQQPLHCNFDGIVSVKFCPNKEGILNTNFCVATKDMVQNHDVNLNGYCFGETYVADIEASQSIKVENGHIVVDGVNACTITIYNLSGAMLATSKTNSLPVTNLPKATYIVTLTTVNSSLTTKIRL